MAAPGWRAPWAAMTCDPGVMIPFWWFEVLRSPAAQRDPGSC